VKLPEAKEDAPEKGEEQEKQLALSATGTSVAEADQPSEATDEPEQTPSEEPSPNDPS
jgi:hypothetical protein